MSLNLFFNPKGIAVIGASTDPAKLGYGVARNLIEGGYPGTVHLVNPKGGELFGQKICTTIAEIPEPLDLAVVIVPAAAAPATLRELGQRGIRAAILTSGGFKETGPEGAGLEAEVAAICKEFGMRLIGPNCIGLLDTHLPLDTTFLAPPAPPRGNLAFLSHSGAFCAAVIDWSHTQGFGFSRLVSLGNQADVTETDLLPLLANDPNTRAICLYLETIPDGSRFIQTTSAITSEKPIVALKVGRTASGQKAAASHTGAMAGSEAALEAAFERAGVLRAGTTEQMFDWARALAFYPLPQGKKIAILTNAGGPGVIAADALEAEGLSLATLSEQTLQKLSELLPPAASAHNPVDMLASASPLLYAGCLSLLLDDPAVDGAVVISPPSPNHPTESIADALIPLIKSSTKPVLVCWMGSHLVTAAREHLEHAGIPSFPFPERAASALGALARQAENSTQNRTIPRPKDIIFSRQGSSPEELVAAYGILSAPLKLAVSSKEATRLAAKLGFPLVAKIASLDILHKSDIGGVLLGIDSSEAAGQAFVALTELTRKARPDARIDGITLQKQILAGQEVILGCVRDRQFGPLMMFGSGGVEAEGLKDVAFALAPLDKTGAEKMLEKTWAGKKLAGYRSIPPADRGAVIDALMRLSWLAIDHPEINEIEINPLRVLQQGAIAVDVRIK